MGLKHNGIFSALGIVKLRDRFFLLLAAFPVIPLAGLLIGAQVAVSLKNLAPAVDAAGRQRMLSQKMLAMAVMATHTHRHSAAEARRTAEEFGAALAALRHGGGAAGLRLSPAPASVLPALDEQEARWLAFRPDYEWVTETGVKKDPAALEQRIGKVEAGAAQLLDSAQRTVSAFERHSAHLIHTTVALMAALAAAGAALFLLAFRAMRRELITPLEELTEAADKAAAGDYSPVFTYSGDDELGMLQSSFGRMCSKTVKDRNARKIATDILTLAIENDTLDAFLEKALTAVLSVPWFTVEPKGAIFLADNASRTLTLKAQRGLHASLLKTCAQVPFGRCLCGRAAQSGELVFAQDVDERHENTYSDISPHGHYCVPLKSGNTLVGVLTLYLEAGHSNDQDEAAQLKSLAGLLAQTIEKRRAHAELRKMAEIIQQASEAVFITGTDGRITYANRAFERMSGFAMAEALGKTPNLLKSGEHPPEYYAEMWTCMQEGRAWTGRIVNKRKDGALYTVQANIFPLKNDAGGTTGYVTIQEDVSGLHEVEEQLRQSQKMEAVGRLAGGVAHDFNNILMAIDSYAKFITPAVSGAPQAAEDLGEITKSVARAAALTRQLLAFSRKQKSVFQVLALRQAVLESEKMLRRLIGENISLSLLDEDGAKTVKADPGQIDQVLMNLLVNAKDAMPDGGRIEIRTGSHKLGTPVPTPMGTMPPGEYATLSVRDSGSGMTRETLSKIFDPFFTTKPQGKGTGLGLSIVYGIIKHHGAYLTVASQPGKGSAFTAYFPVFTEPAPRQGGNAVKPPAALPPGLTVLLTEDDPAVRASVTRMLLALGAKVEAFQSPEEALKFTAGYTARIDLLVTDIVMAGMDGFALAERIAEKYPKAAVVYMSGYTDPDIFKGRLEKPGVFFLQKPFDGNLLAGTAARALAAKGTA